MNITYLGQQTAQSDSPANKQWLFAATTDPIYDDGDVDCQRRHRSKILTPPRVQSQPCRPKHLWPRPFRPKYQGQSITAKSTRRRRSHRMRRRSHRCHQRNPPLQSASHASQSTSHASAIIAAHRSHHCHQLAHHSRRPKGSPSTMRAASSPSSQPSTERVSINDEGSIIAVATKREQSMHLPCEENWF